VKKTKGKLGQDTDCLDHGSNPHLHLVIVCGCTGELIRKGSCCLRGLACSCSVNNRSSVDVLMSKCNGSLLHVDEAKQISGIQLFLLFFFNIVCIYLSAVISSVCSGSLCVKVNDTTAVYLLPRVLYVHQRDSVL
jgi:hypothetical protein